jgi:hypothetical protein
MNKDIKDFNNGIIPDKFNFSIKTKTSLDISKVMYNNRYKTIEYHRNKFPAGNIIGFEKILEYMALNCKTPEQEILERINILD